LLTTRQHTATQLRICRVWSKQRALHAPIRPLPSIRSRHVAIAPHRSPQRASGTLAGRPIRRADPPNAYEPGPGRGALTLLPPIYRLAAPARLPLLPPHSSDPAAPAACNRYVKATGRPRAHPRARALLGRRAGRVSVCESYGVAGESLAYGMESRGGGCHRSGRRAHFYTLICLHYGSQSPAPACRQANAQVPFLATLHLRTVISLTPEFPVRQLIAFTRSGGIDFVSAPSSSRQAYAGRPGRGVPMHKKHSSRMGPAAYTKHAAHALACFPALRAPSRSRPAAPRHDPLAPARRLETDPGRGGQGDARDCAGPAQSSGVASGPVSRAPSGRECAVRTGA
jgi:hypothetical protein